MGQVDKKLAPLFVCLFLASISYAQYNIGFSESANLEFSIDGALRQPTVGGFSNVQLSEIHLNNDGFEDLFVFDRANDIWRTFLFNPSSSEYDYAPEFESIFPNSLNEWVLLRDYDCDQKIDLFTYNNGGFRVYQNNGETPPNFNLVTDAVQSDYGSLITSAFVLPGDVPAIVDVDMDGDLDLLTFGNGDSENSVVWHENRSMDEYGSCDSLEFVVNTECWGGFEEPSNASSLEAISCRPEPAPPIPWHQLANRHHPGSSLLLTDVNGDTTLDVIIGDIQTKTLVYAMNVGDPQSPSIDVSTQTTQFPNASDPANMQYMVSGYEIDADQDGKMDLAITTNNNIDSSCNAGHIWMYSNSASVGKNYTLTSTSFLLDEMIDLGTGAIPVVLDVDGDDLDDLLVAVDFYRSPINSTLSRLHYFKNTGTETNPLFTHQDDDFASLSSFGFQAVFPALGDLDGDGDQDMVVGDADGFLHYFQNNPTGSTASFSLFAANYMGINTIGQNAAPQIVDVNGDGLLDLLVGERMGTISYFENNGTTASASFTSAPTIETFGKIDVSFFCCNGNAAPILVDQPEFGPDAYLFVGTSEKRINVYQIPQNLNDSFLMVDSLLLLADRIAPTHADFDNNGVVDLLIGTGSGGLKYYERPDNYPVGIARNSSQKKAAFLVYPNPAKNEFTVQMTPSLGPITIEVYSSLGRLIHRAENAENQVRIETANWPSGIYFVQVRSSQAHSVEKIAIKH